MSWASSEIVGVLVFLLPGFVAAAVFYSLTSHSKPGAFDLIIQALIFTAAGQAITSAIILVFGATVGNVAWAENWGFVLSLVVSVFLAVLVAYVLNNDVAHRVLRRIRITRETSYPSEWYSTFARHECYVVLHMKGQRYLYGWPEEWPSRPDEGHFRITEAEWLESDRRTPAEGADRTGDLIGDDGDGRTPAEGVAAILIPAGEVEMVEFVEYPEQPERT